MTEAEKNGLKSDQSLELMNLRIDESFQVDANRKKAEISSLGSMDLRKNVLR